MLIRFLPGSFRIIQDINTFYMNQNVKLII